MSTRRGREEDCVVILYARLRCVLGGDRRRGGDDHQHDVSADHQDVDQDRDDGDHLGADADGHGDEQDEQRDDGPGGGATGPAPPRWRRIRPLSSSGRRDTSDSGCDVRHARRPSQAEHTFPADHVLGRHTVDADDSWAGIPPSGLSIVAIDTTVPRMANTPVPLQLAVGPPSTPRNFRRCGKGQPHPPIADQRSGRGVPRGSVGCRDTATGGSRAGGRWRRRAIDPAGSRGARRQSDRGPATRHDPAPPRRWQGYDT
jgi:hypothetical protein